MYTTTTYTFYSVHIVDSSSAVQIPKEIIYYVHI